jgi:hypothetical protein
MPAPSVEWRGRFGGQWLATIQNQNPCNNCWAFAAAAMVETMVRIEHHVWSKRSEGDLRDGFMGSLNPPAADPCDHGAGVQDALAWISGIGQGIADPDCYPWYDANHSYQPTWDRLGRTVRIPEITALNSIDDQKTWIDAVGPICAPVDVYQTFGSLGTGVWMPTSLDVDVPNQWPKGHVVLIVGYDDANQCWIFRNSWGTTFGDQGYGRIGYGQANIDYYTKYGVQLTSPDPWTRRRMHSGCMIESSNGQAHRNFEMLRAAAPRIRHQWRQGGEGGDFSWHDAGELENPNDIGAGAACIGFPALTSTTFGRNFECVYWEGSGHLHHWFFDQQAQHWVDGGRFGPPDLQGYPGFIQSNFGPGNFEVVVRTSDGRLCHWFRINHDPWTWGESTRFGSNIRQSGPALLQTRYGNNASNLEVVCVRNDGQMQHFWRDDDLTWQTGVTFGQGVGDTPVCMIEGQYGATDETRTGNFELCVAVNGVGQHWYRDNNGDGGWHHTADFGDNVKHVWALVESSFDFNLEVLVERTDGAVQHWWRDDSGWHDGGIVNPA